MLIHITPRLFCHGYPGSCELIDISIPELDLKLKNGVEVVATTPYPNKNYLVARRKIGRKMLSGLFIETGDAIGSFNVITRWARNAGVLMTHSVNYIVLDKDRDAISDNMVMWYGSTGGKLGKFASRLPAWWVDGVSPANSMPRMDVLLLRGGEVERRGEFKDIASAPGSIFLQERHETFRLPTLERERLLGYRADGERLPLLAHAFHFSQSAA